MKTLKALGKWAFYLLLALLWIGYYQRTDDIGQVVAVALALFWFCLFQYLKQRDADRRQVELRIGNLQGQIERQEAAIWRLHDRITELEGRRPVSFDDA